MDVFKKSGLTGSYSVNQGLLTQLFSFMILSFDGFF